MPAIIVMALAISLIVTILEILNGFLNTDKELIKVLENLFGIKYAVELTEEITKDSLEEIKRKMLQICEIC